MVEIFDARDADATAGNIARWWNSRAAVLDRLAAAEKVANTAIEWERVGAVGAEPTKEEWNDARDAYMAALDEWEETYGQAE